MSKLQILVNLLLLVTLPKVISILGRLLISITQQEAEGTIRHQNRKLGL
jgi:hypothetical protein